MPRKVYFSFHYQEDIHRVVRIRNSGAIKETGQPFVDKAEWEKIKHAGKKAIREWIDKQMKGTSVLILCIGMETWSREWVLYELQKAHNDGKGILGIYMNKMRDLNKGSIGKGRNPMAQIYVQDNGRDILMSKFYYTYSWVDDDGYNNIENWIADAAADAGR